MRIVLAFLLCLSCTTIVAAVSWQPPQPDQWYGLEPITVCYATDAVHAEMTHIDTGEILFAPIATKLLIDQTEEGFQITNIVAFEHRAAPVLLPVVLSSSTQAQPQPIRVSPPQGVNMQLAGTDALQDGAGVIYYKTRDRSSPSRGDIVWKVEGDTPVVVLEPGKAETEGNGSLAELGGVGYLVTVDHDNRLVLYPIPGWVK